MVHISATAWPPLSRTIPFGLPVVPEVYSTYSGSVAATGTGSTGSASAMAVGPVDVAASLEFARPLLALQDHARRGVVAGRFECGVDHRLVVDDARRLDAARCRYDDGGPGIVDARGEFVGGESAEDHGVDGAEPRAGQHRDDRLGHHRHVDHDAVALADAEAAQHAGEPRGLVEQFAVGVGALGPGERRVVDQCGLVGAAVGDVSVESVRAGVQFGIGKPAVERGIGVVEDALRLAGPGDRARGVGPECFGVVDAGVEQFSVSGHTGTLVPSA